MDVPTTTSTTTATYRLVEHSFWMGIRGVWWELAILLGLGVVFRFLAEWRRTSRRRRRWWA
jgi:hypothetical protein